MLPSDRGLHFRQGPTLRMCQQFRPLKPGTSYPVHLQCLYPFRLLAGLAVYSHNFGLAVIRLHLVQCLYVYQLRYLAGICGHNRPPFFGRFVSPLLACIISPLSLFWGLNSKNLLIFEVFLHLGPKKAKKGAFFMSSEPPFLGPMFVRFSLNSQNRPQKGAFSWVTQKKV